MKRVIALLLSISLVFTGCGISKYKNTESNIPSVENEKVSDKDDKTTDGDLIEDEELEFSSLNDENLLQYVEDSVYAGLTDSLETEDYVVENVSTVYISKEYLEELTYNSQSNIYFGYTLDDIESQFDGEKYIFTCDEEGNTVVTAYENYDDTYNQVVRNVAIGTGVILICVTVSIVSGGVGAPAAVSAVFAASAKTATSFALSTSVINGAMAAIVTGYETRDVKETVDATALAASEGFMWGAITGAVVGSATEGLSIARAARKIPTARESELYALEKLGGEEQVSYLAGERVPANTPGATRPDVLREVGGKLEAVEVKNYDLANSSNRKHLYRELERQVTSRVNNLPEGTTQRIILDTRNRGYSNELTAQVVENIQSRLSTIYPNIPIEVW